MCRQDASLLDELLQVALPQLLVQLLQLLLLDLMVSGWKNVLVATKQYQQTTFVRLHQSVIVVKL